MNTPLDHLSDLAPLFPRTFAHMTREQQAETLMAYADNLTDFPEETVGSACAELARTEEWFPSLAKIRERCAELVLQLPTEDEALAQIEACVGQEGSSAKMHPLVRSALNLVGGFAAWRVSEEPTVLRGQFCRLYREARVREMRDCQVGQPALVAGPEVKTLKEGWPQRPRSRP